jgi:glycosyltransferase involved in cell wall biosynthesis
LEQAILVINAANHDNGSYSMIESVWFGKPLISSDYPAARNIDERFDLHCHWFENGNAESLARALPQAVRTTPMDKESLYGVQARLGQRELSLRVYAERFYETLLQEVLRVKA